MTPHRWERSALLCLLAVGGSTHAFVPPLQSKIIPYKQQARQAAKSKEENSVPKETPKEHNGHQPPDEGRQQPFPENALLEEIHSLQQSLSQFQQDKSRKTPSTDSASKDKDRAHHHPQEEEETLEIELDRAAFRMDGLEVYAVVSALTLATSIQFFDLSSEHWHWGRALPTNWEALAADLICLIASAVGMITGLHATLVFSLMTVYGRTAVGMGWDESFAQFFHQTGAVRCRGFRSFRISLYSFAVQILFLIVSRLPPSKWIRRLGSLILSTAMWRVYGDTQFIIRKAGSMLFINSGAPTKPGSEEVLDGNQSAEEQEAPSDIHDFRP